METFEDRPAGETTVLLNNGVRMPWLGLGVWRAAEGGEVAGAVAAAVAMGYRSIDTAANYGNEFGVGLGLRRSGALREDVFVATKVWNADHGYDSTLRACGESLHKLQLDYVDLYLIHWPVRGKYKETWRALETLYRDGKARAIGVSNFQIHHLEDLLETCSIVPAINQVEYHPLLQQRELLAYCRGRNIRLEAWSPLMQGGTLLADPTIGTIAAKHGKTAAQVILRWDVQTGVVTIPKSVNERRMAENIGIFDFALDEDDLRDIGRMDREQRVGPHPDHFDF